MDKLDFKKRDRTFYTGKVGHWDRPSVPPMTCPGVEGLRTILRQPVRAARA